MSQFKEQLESFLHEDNETSPRKDNYNELLDENPQAVAEEIELSNLIELSFSSLDVKESVLKKIHNNNQKPVSEFALNVVEELKQTKNKKNDAVKFIIFASAALLTLSLVFWGGSPKDSLEIVSVPKETAPEIKNEPEQLKKDFPKAASKPEIISSENLVKTNIDEGDTIRGEGVLQLPEGVKVLSYAQAQYSFEAKDKSFLKMKHGKALVDVKSRKGKIPLYFNLPHGQVEVTGTQFELLASQDISSVMVTEGTVNYLAGNEQVTISEGQLGISSETFLKASYKLSGTLLHYSFDSSEAIPANLKNPQISYGASGNALHLKKQTFLDFESLPSSSTRSLSFWINANELADEKRTVLTLTERKNKLHFYMEGDNIVMLTQMGKGKPRKVSYRIRHGWHHIALNQQNNQYELHLNNKNIQRGVLPAFIKPQISLGSNTNGFNGKIDELRILNRKLSHEEIRKLKEEREMSYQLK